MDNEILIELYKKQANIIFAYLIKVGCSYEEAEDIVQDSFIKAIEYMEGVDTNKLTSWLFKVAINDYKNRLKRKSILSKVSINDGKLVSDNSVLKDILIKEKNKDIEACLNSMKEPYKSLLILKYELELRYSEISVLLGISQDVVKTYLYRARKKFKEFWEEMYHE